MGEEGVYPLLGGSPPDTEYSGDGPCSTGIFSDEVFVFFLIEGSLQDGRVHYSCSHPLSCNGKGGRWGGDVLPLLELFAAETLFFVSTYVTNTVGHALKIPTRMYWYIRRGILELEKHVFFPPGDSPKLLF